MFRTLHQLLGLSLGLVLVSQGLSGAILVWRPDLDRLMLPKLTHAAGMGRQVSLDSELQAVRIAVPGSEVRMVRLAGKPDGADEWNLSLSPLRAKGMEENGARRETVYTSPATAEVLGIRGAQRDALSFLVELHHSLLMGPLGRGVLGYVAITTILLSLTGVWLWWPKRWTPSRFRPRAAAKPLHYALGFWAMIPLLVIATTALYFVWRQPLQKLFGVYEPRPAMGQTAGEGGEHRRHGHRPDARPADRMPAASLDALMASAQAALPEEREVAVRFPERGGGDYTVMFEHWQQHYRAAPDSVRVRVTADGKAEIAGVSRWEQLPPMRRVLEWLPRIHQAEAGGIPMKVLWSFTGCMPGVLYVSGFLMWRRRVGAARSL